jgi:hypothetical protein
MRDDEHALAGEVDLRRWRQCGAAVAPDGREGDGEVEGGAAAFLALDGDGAAHALDDVPADGEAEPGAPVAAARGVVDLLELAEDRVLAALGNAGAGVGDAEGDEPVAAHLDADADTALIGELHRIAGKVHQHLAQPVAVAHDEGWQVRRDEARDLDALALRTRGEKLDDVLDEAAQVERLLHEGDLAGLDL